MNQDQVQSLLRQLLAAVGPLAALAIQLGYPQGQVDGWVRAVQAILGVGTIVASIVWGANAHTDANKALAADSVPGVKVTVNPVAASQAVIDMATKTTNNVALAA